MTVAGGIPVIRYDLGSLLPMASPYLTQIALVNSPLDIGLPSVSISLAAGVVVTHAIAMISFRSIYNTNVLANSLSGGQDIQAIDPVTGNLVTVFSFGGGELATDPATFSGGDVLVGQYDFASGVTIADGDTLGFQWTGAQSAFPNLNINDIQIILRLQVN